MNTFCLKCVDLVYTNFKNLYVLRVWWTQMSVKLILIIYFFNLEFLSFYRFLFLFIAFILFRVLTHKNAFLPQIAVRATKALR